MITFTLLDIMTCVVLSFTIALYVGAFIQRRRDAKENDAGRATLIRVLDMVAKSVIKKKGTEE